MQNSGIATEIYSLINNEEVSPTTNLVISKCSASDYLDNSNPNLEKLTTQYYETFSITGKLTGAFAHITIGDFFNTLSSKFCESTAVLGGLNATARKEQEKNSDSETIVINQEDLIAGTSSVTGKRGTENFGIAVFNEDILCGELTVIESISHLLITNEINSCIISIDNPLTDNQSEKIELLITPSKKSKISVDIKDNKPYITIGLSLDADIMTLNKGINYEISEVLEKISEETNSYLNEQINSYLNKVSKEYCVDIDNFCAKGPSHFSTISEWEKFNWKEKFKNAEFNVNIDVNVLSTMLITKT